MFKEGMKIFRQIGFSEDVSVTTKGNVNENLLYPAVSYIGPL